MSVELPPPSTTVLAVNASFADGVLSSRFVGTADIEAKPYLDEVVKKLQAEAQRLAVTKVEIDFRELEFMNSSSFKVFVAWLAAVQELSADKQYRIHLRSNPNLHW